MPLVTNQRLRYSLVSNSLAESLSVAQYVNINIYCQNYDAGLCVTDEDRVI